MRKIELSREKVALILFILVSILALAAVAFWGGNRTDEVFLNDIPDGFVLQDRVPGVRYILPEDVIENEVPFDTMGAHSPDDLALLIQTKYISRKEAYGAMIVGPEMMNLVVCDKDLFRMSLENVSYTDEVEYILKKEAQLGDGLSVQNNIRKNQEDGCTKIIVPIRFKYFSFSDLEVEGSYEGYAALIEKEDGGKAICIAVANTKGSAEQVKKWKESCSQSVMSFRISNSDYSSYSNKLSEFSYDPGGLVNYPGYIYKNLGTKQMDTAGTYNQVDAMLGMYCVETPYGPINMPYILNDQDLTSYVSTEDGLHAEIHSKTDTVQYSVLIQDVTQETSFESVVDEVRGSIQGDYTVFMEEKGYTKKQVVSEDIKEDSGSALITVCGWNENTGDSTIIYYDLKVSKNVYTITRIETSKKVTDEFDPIVTSITSLHHIVLV